MSLRLEMLQVSRLAPQLLGDSTDLVREFIADCLTEDGGFADREGHADLYYTVFGLAAMQSLDLPVPTGRVASYLDGFGAGDGLDLVHLSCLARCWASLDGHTLDDDRRRAIAANLESFRTDAGTYSDDAKNADEDVYASFIVFGAYQDLAVPFPDGDALISLVRRMQTPDGGYANSRWLDVGTTPVTSGAIILQRHLGHTVPDEAIDWLLRQRHAQGGFLAAPQAPMPDLLSTATSIHALAGVQYPFEELLDPCLDFVDSLWTNRGAFHGHWADDEVDCEYTYYGLLALGHLSVWQR